MGADGRSDELHVKMYWKRMPARASLAPLLLSERETPKKGYANTSTLLNIDVTPWFVTDSFRDFCVFDN